MKYFIRSIQIITGLLFIVSGLVKANDPLGLSYKMQEFFELWSSSLANGHLLFKSVLLGSMEFLHDHSLSLSVFIIALEVITGLALLLAWNKNFFLYLLLILILFFGFLTGYAFLSGKFTNCGCFGDCLPISPLTSFIKDMVLLVMILLLIGGKKYLLPLLSAPKSLAVLGIGIISVAGLQLYVLNYLPLVDCLPFKVGNNIKAEMKPPPNAVPDSFAIKFIYEKQGRRFEFSPDNLPADFTTYQFIDRKQQLIRKGNAEPAIKGFSLVGTSGTDSTEIILNQPRAALLFLLNDANEKLWVNDFRGLLVKAGARHVPVYVVTSDPEGIARKFLTGRVQVQIFTCDFTVIRTAARSNPTLYILQNGTVSKKYGFRKLNQAVKDLNDNNN